MGIRRWRAADVAVLLGRQPGAGRRDAGRDRGIRGPGSPAGPPMLIDSRARAGRAGTLGPARAVLGPPPRGQGGAAGTCHVRRAARASRSAGTCRAPGRTQHPAAGLRGRGIAAHGMATVVAIALESIAPVVTLYVNDFNAPARAAYRRVGFAEAGTFMSVLF